LRKLLQPGWSTQPIERTSVCPLTVAPWMSISPRTPGMSIGSAAALVAVAGVVEFRRAKTTVNPLKLDKSTQLVASGIYRFTRNPMYLGMLLILVGWAIHLQHIGAWLWLIGFILFINRFQIEPEERAMTKLFGEPYIDYCKSVRRWF